MLIARLDVNPNKRRLLLALIICCHDMHVNLCSDRAVPVTLDELVA